MARHTGPNDSEPERRRRRSPDESTPDDNDVFNWHPDAAGRATPSTPVPADQVPSGQVPSGSASPDPATSAQPPTTSARATRAAETDGLAAAGLTGHADDGPGQAPADLDKPMRVDRRFVIASTVVASIAGARIAMLAAPAPEATVPRVPTVTGSASTPVPQPTSLSPNPSTAVRFISPYDFGLVDGAADNTAPMQAMLDALILNPGARAVLPAGVINVSTLAIDYANVDAQPESGAPYGYPGPKIEGSSKRGTIIRQIDGTVGDVLTIQGKINQAAGPANNNKISGLSLSNLEIQGATTGGNGIYLRSIVDSSFEEITVTNCDSGIYLARESFVSGQYDEYFYNNTFRHMKLLANRKWGVECSGTNAIAASFYDCEATTNYLGGYKLAPSGMIMVHCLAIGNGTYSPDGRGVWSVTNTNNFSTNNGLNLIGCRFEGNSTEGGYELEIESGYGHVVSSPQFFATTGATLLGVGLRGVDDSKRVRNLVVTGGYYGGDRVTGSQKLAKLGDKALNTTFDNLGVDPAQWANGSQVSDLVDDSSLSLSVNDPSRFRTAADGYLALSPVSGDLPGPESPSQANFGIVTGSDGKQSLVVRFPSGDSKVIASES